MARRAIAFWSQPVVFDQISIAPNQYFATLMAVRIFQILYPPGKVASVDIAQSCFTADSGGAQQILGTRISGRRHFVVLVKGGDVPGDVGRNAG